MNGLVGEIGEMDIPLNPEARPIRHIPYRLNPIYKEKEKSEIDKMLEVGVIELNDAFLHDNFPTQFTEEVLENVGGQESYSFTDRFSGYHQIKIALEYRHKTTFSTYWGSFQYTIIPFGLKNAPTIFSRVVVVAFKDLIHKFLEDYLNDWKMFILFKDLVEVLILILDRCKQCQISLNIKKCIFSAPFGILLGHTMCKQCMLVDPAKIVFIINLPPPKLVL
jgi:hypothetical protein